ncbi:uncharacterized protein LOC144097518 [Amblyomma americanum]
MRTCAGKVFSLLLCAFALACAALLVVGGWGILFWPAEYWRQAVLPEVATVGMHIDPFELVRPGAGGLGEETGSAWAVRYECRRRADVDTIFLFHSMPEAWQSRAALRDTLLSKWARDFFNWTGIFIVGLEETVGADISTDAWTEFEATTIGDMVRLNMSDEYAAVNAKFLAGLNWATLHCPRIRYVVKLDDDVAVEPFLFRRYLNNVHPTARVIYCTHQEHSRLLRHSLRSGHSLDLQGEPDYGYCSGRTVIMNTPTAEDIVRASRVVTAHSTDDLYVTGELALVAKLTHQSLSFTSPRESEGIEVAIEGNDMLTHMEGAFGQTSERRAAWHTAIWNETRTSSGQLDAAALHSGAHLSARLLRGQSAIRDWLQRTSAPAASPTLLETTPGLSSNASAPVDQLIHENN